ncbi:PREDICTED: odorant receptor 83a-like [Nicrophorus vespilloides]|uniref:Odorant receptor n=1 Tax=Nicrophorus vespilloides TaxID=110193 RepID=A0ABM1N596_NICVS|nr:PREDICTED: odorant receptor 83a-like [Nicrophorus vespilloides]
MQYEYLKKNVVILKLMSMYKTDARWNWLQTLLYYCWRTIWYYSLLSTVFYLILEIALNESKQDMTYISISFMHLGLFASISIRTMHFILNLDTAEKLIQKIREEFQPGTKLANRPVTMEATYRWCERFFTVWTAFVIFAGLMMAVAVVLNPEREMVLPVWTFYDWKTTPAYQITIFLQTMSQLNMVISFSNLDLLSMCFMVLSAEQFRILAADFASTVEDAFRACGCSQKQLEDLDMNVDAIVRSSKFQRRLRQNFNGCIEQHQKLLNLFTAYQRFVSPNLVIEVYFNYIYMIFTLYVFVATSDTSLYLGLSQYCLGSVLQIYLLCYFGQQLSTSVEEMRLALYTVPWYVVNNKSFLQNYHIVLMRMKRPVRIVAGKILPLANDTFLEFMKKAFSSFTVLRQMQLK